MDKKVSVVIPTFNRKNAIIKIINSYLQQKHLHELIFVDDGSTDGTEEYLRAQASLNPLIKYRRHDRNKGVSMARNAGIEMATGDYILFGEDDVYLNDDYIDILIGYLEKMKVEIVAGRIFYSKTGETFKDTITRCEEKRGPLINYWLMSGNYSIKIQEPVPMPFLHAISLGKADVCRQIKFDPAFFAREETDFYLRAYDAGYRIIFCPEAICVHLQRDREGGGGWKVGPLKYQLLATKNNNMLVDRHFALLKKWGMKGNKLTFKLLHLINRFRILYLYNRDSTRNSRYRVGFLMHGARNIGGGEHSIYSLIKEIDKNIFEPFVFFSIENDLIRRLGEQNIRTVNFPMKSSLTSVYRDEIQRKPLNLILYLFYFSLSVFQMIRYLRKYQIDILHPHDNLSKIMGGIAGRLCSVKLVSHCRDQLEDKKMDRLLGKWQVAMFDRVIAVSNCVREILVSLTRNNGKKIITIYNGVDLEKFNPDSYPPAIGGEAFPSDKKDTVIAVIGVFDKVKGHSLLFEALKYLMTRNITGFQCWVIGTGRDEEVLKNQVGKNGVSSRVRFLGYREDIPSLLKQIDIIVIPSRREAFCRVAVEAMAMEVPVVATRVGGLPELIEHDRTGLLVSPGDVVSLATAIHYLMERPALRKQMGKLGRERAEKYFRLEENVRKTERCYLDVLKKNALSM